MLKENLLKNEKVKPNSREKELLKQNFPQFFSKEGEFLLEKFKEMLKMEDVKIDKEGYELKFLGKNYARFLTSTETENVIVPNIKHNEEEINKNSENLYIIGDNLDALKHLLNSYSGKIKCIYIDPPYNTGSDGFVYNDNFEYTAENISEKMGIELEEAQRIIDMRGKSTHSAWLTFMYSRLALARDLLSEDGVIFISIDDNEQANLKMICNEIFGEENFIGMVICDKGNAQNDAINLQKNHEYIIIYSKTINKLLSENKVSKKEVFIEKDKYYYLGSGIVTGGEGGTLNRRPNLGYTIYYNKKTEDKIAILDYNIEKAKKLNDENEIYSDNEELLSKGYVKIRPPKKGNLLGCWTWSLEKFNNEKNKIFISESENNFIIKKKEYVSSKKVFYEKNKNFILTNDKTNVRSIWNFISSKGTKELKELFEKKVFENSKNKDMIMKIISIATKKDSIILDFFSGSATTAHAVMQLNAEDVGNRKYIMVQLPEKTYKEKLNKKKKIKIVETPAYKAGYKTIDEIGIERIKRAAKKIQNETQAELDYGFKIVKLEALNKNTLDKIVDFNPDDNKLILDNFIDEFKFGETEGYDTILTTWLNQDGYGMNVKSKKVLLKNFEIDVFEDSAYVIKDGISSEDVMELITRVEKNEIEITRLVVYPYSVSFNVLHEMKKNFKNLRGNKELKLIERY